MHTLTNTPPATREVLIGHGITLPVHAANLAEIVLACRAYGGDDLLNGLDRLEGLTDVHAVDDAIRNVDRLTDTYPTTDPSGWGPIAQRDANNYEAAVSRLELALGVA